MHISEFINTGSLSTWIINERTYFCNALILLAPVI